MSDELTEALDTLKAELTALRPDLPPEFRVVAALLVVILVLVNRLLAAAEAPHRKAAER